MCTMKPSCNLSAKLRQYFRIYVIDFSTVFRIDIDQSDLDKKYTSRLFRFFIPHPRFRLRDVIHFFFFNKYSNKIIYIHRFYKHHIFLNIDISTNGFTIFFTVVRPKSISYTPRTLVNRPGFAFTVPYRRFLTVKKKNATFSIFYDHRDLLLRRVMF